MEKNNRIARVRSIAAVVMAGVMVAAMVPQISSRAEADGERDWKNPVMEEAYMSGQKVSWDCIYFGEYPQSEVVSGDSVYTMLQNAEGWDAKGDLLVDGVKYRRMLKGDALHAEGYDSYEAYAKEPSYYYWADGTTYHYFKYEPIKWRVLEKDGDQALLLADVMLDNMKYNSQWEGVKWENCSVRSWLNGYDDASNYLREDFTKDNFLQDAFDDAQQQAIKVTKVANPNPLTYGTYGGNDTEDKLFLLSERDVYTENAVKYGFVADAAISDDAKRATCSTYAWALGIYKAPDGMFQGNGYWWLRTPGQLQNDARCVYDGGYVHLDGDGVHRNKNGVRPALTLDLTKTDVYTYAGEVHSNGDVLGGDQIIDNPKVIDTGRKMSVNQKTTWDCIYAGQYPQSEVTEEALYAQLESVTEWKENSTTFDDVRYYKVSGAVNRYFRYEPMKWRILETDGKMAIVLADSIVDAKPFHNSKKNITWEKSTLRSWLNGYGSSVNGLAVDYSNSNFMDLCFTQEEQEMILEIELENKDNSSFKTDSGKNTTDKIYILGESDVYGNGAISHGFMSNRYLMDNGRRAWATDFAKAMGAACSEDEAYMGNASWWLRTAGRLKNCAVQVTDRGIGEPEGRAVNVTSLGVRPVMKIDLTRTDLYQDAGTVCSDGTVKEPQKLPEPSESPMPTLTPSESPTPTPTETTPPAVSESPTPTETTPPAVSESPTPTPSAGKLGDADGNGNVELADAQYTLRVALKLTTMDEDARMRADADKDIQITLQDAQMILKAALKIIQL